MPWLLVPVLPLLLYNSPAFAGVSLSLPYLLIPIAAWLGRRYGAAGFIAILLGGLLALVPYLDMSAGSFGGAFAVYFICIYVCRAACADNPAQALMGDGRILRQPWVFPVTLIFLPLSLYSGRYDLQEDLVVDFYFTLLPLCFFILFLLGVAGLRAGLAVGGIVGAVLLGIILEIAHVPNLGTVEYQYHLDDLATLVTALGYFVAGRAVTDADATRNPWRLRYVTTAAFVILALMPQIISAFLPDLPPIPDYIGLNGQYLALPLAALMAGYLLGYGGIGFCLVVTLLLIAACNAALLLLAQRGLWIYAEQPLFCLAFGLLGLRLRDAQTGVPRPWPGGRWYVYGLLVLLFLPVLFSPAQLLDLAWPFIMAFGAALLALAIAWLRRRLKLQDITLTGEGWLKLAGALAVLAGIVVNARHLLEGMLAEAASLDLPIEIALPAALVLLHLPLAYLAYVMARVWPKVAGDLQSIARWWREPRP